MKLRSNMAAFATGALFALGLAVSGMTKPAKVVGFLDLAGAWDPSLALVMAGAVAVHLATQRWIRRRSTPLFDTTFHVPTRKDIDVRLLAGAALFGIGWGLAGYCPGPGLVSAASGVPNALWFVAAMTLGMWIEHAAARAVGFAHRSSRPTRASRCPAGTSPARSRGA
jgi:hypothetical protein